MEAIDFVASKSPLHLAARHGRLTLVELLVLYGAVIDSRDGSLRTPLHRWVKNFCLLLSFKGRGCSMIQVGKCSPYIIILYCFIWV